MNIQEALKLGPNFIIPYYGLRGVEIPKATRSDLPKYLYDLGCRVGVEIGVDKGEFGVELCKAGLKVTGIDSYVPYKGYKEPRYYSSHYQEALKNLKGYDYKIINKFSIDSLTDFEDGSLDFVFIDGNHTFPYIAQDIFSWERKVKVSGVISGHDYAFVKGLGERVRPMTYDGTHVKGAVDVCAYIMRIDKLYVLGKRTESGRDRWRSWFWVKL